MPPTSRRRRAVLAAAAVAIAAAIAAGAVWAVVAAQPATEAAPAPTRSTPAPSTTPTPTPTPTPTGPPADTAVHPLDGLPAVDVFAVVPQLPVDDDRLGALSGDLVTPVAERVPVFAAPGGAPVATLARTQAYEGTTVPVVVREEHWVRVLLTGRAATPSTGDPAQLTGWLRVQDVEWSRAEAQVEVDLAGRTVEIVHVDGSRERVADDLGWGTDATPTPIGRTFVMMVRVEPSFTYTRGHPIVYLAAQSPTLDGFGGADVAVTAFHYHDARSGAISNGCLRLGPEASDRIAQLPPGTPVVVRG